MASLHKRNIVSVVWLFIGYLVINSVVANNATNEANNIYVSDAPGQVTTAGQNVIVQGSTTTKAVPTTTTTVMPTSKITTTVKTSTTTVQPSTKTVQPSTTTILPKSSTTMGAESKHKEGCMAGIEKCRTEHKQLAYDGLPVNVYSPDQLKQHCSGKGYSHCLNSTITRSTCTLYQKFTVEGEQLAEKYVCSEEAINLYGEKNEYTDHPWENLKKFYMPEENKLCKKDFLIPSIEYLEKYEKLMKQKSEVADEIAVLDTQTDETNPNKGDQIKVLAQKESDLQIKATKENEHYCNYMYVYQDCIELAAKRHCNDTISNWQYEMISQHFTPHFKHMGCQIGKGMKPLHLSAIIIVSVVLGLIFSLALFCGVYEKCFEKIKICRRRNDSADDLEALANNGDKRQNVMLPGENGLPQRTGSSSKVRFGSHDDVRKMSS